jgi:hypothetical protein
MTTAILRKLRVMDGAELRFRAATALRTRIDRARASWRPPAWDRSRLRLSQVAAPRRALDACARGDWRAAHGALATHFQGRPPRFPLAPSRLPAIATSVRDRFALSTERADRVLDGRYDLLGYRSVDAGALPDWHRDPVHDRTAPVVFWEAVPYLDPAYGDHKVTWEINRHQHFLALGRAYSLTGDRRYYDAFVRQLTVVQRRVVTLPARHSPRDRDVLPRYCFLNAIRYTPAGNAAPWPSVPSQRIACGPAPNSPRANSARRPPFKSCADTSTRVSRASSNRYTISTARAPDPSTYGADAFAPTRLARSPGITGVPGLSAAKQ